MTQSTQECYYWSDTFRNKEGKTLQECLNQYGTKLTRMPNGNAIYKVIFLDSSKNLGNAWMLWFRNKEKIYYKVRLYEEDPETYLILEKILKIILKRRIKNYNYLLLNNYKILIEDYGF